MTDPRVREITAKLEAMTDPRVQEIIARLSQPNRHRLSWPERIMWGITTALVAITLLGLLLSP